MSPIDNFFVKIQKSVKIITILGQISHFESSLPSHPRPCRDGCEDDTEEEQQEGDQEDQGELPQAPEEDTEEEQQEGDQEDQGELLLQVGQPAGLAAIFNFIQPVGRDSSLSCKTRMRLFPRAG